MPHFTGQYITDPELRRRIEAIENLPTLPEVYTKLCTELSKPNPNMHDVAAIISHDVAISAKLLHMINSAYFGLKTRVESVLQAVNLLGVETVKGIVLTASVYKGEGNAKIPGYSPKEIYDRAVGVGAKSRFIAYSFGLPRNEVDYALTSGLLHDIGKLVLLTNFTEEFKRVLARSERDSIPMHEAQEMELGADDAAIGAFLLETWKLPEKIIDAVAVHYCPSKWGKNQLDSCAAVHIAYASEQDRLQHHGGSARSAFDRGLTDKLGLSDQLASYVGMAPEAVS
ncbi:MAG: HDOD domain-containing protein [Candidatus Zixiibacteriota bacterium]